MAVQAPSRRVMTPSTTVQPTQVISYKQGQKVVILNSLEINIASATGHGTFVSGIIGAQDLVYVGSLYMP